MKLLRYIAAIFVITAMLAPAPVSAATFRGDENSVTIKRDQTLNDDLYAAADTVTISGTVNGDVVVVGSTIIIDGTVNGNVWAGASNLTITGTVSQSVRGFGGKINFSGKIGGDALLASNELSLTRDASVGRDAIVGADRLSLNGAIGRDVKSAARETIIGGTINGNVQSTSSERLSLSSGSLISGSLTYRAPEEVRKDPGATVSGQTTYQKGGGEKQPTLLDRWRDQLYWFLASVLILLGLLLYARRALIVATEAVSSRPGRTILSGLVFTILTPILALIVFITIVGIPLSLIALTAYILIAYLAKIFTGLWLGRLLFRQPETFWPVLGAGIAGLGIYYLLGVLPVIGWIVGLLTLLIGAGAQVQLIKSVYSDARAKYGS